MANLELWRNSLSPFRDFMSLGRSFDRMLEDWPINRAEMTKYNFNPSCEVREEKGAYVLKADLPGIPKESIKIDLVDNRLTLSGERSEEKKVSEHEGTTHFSEMFYGSFSRSIAFPVAVNAEKVEAHYEDGVLTITIPKKSPQGTRQIAIQ